ncbi:MAG: hybrid sensor histidine kinase/response regulator [Bacteroidota bacterium]
MIGFKHNDFTILIVDDVPKNIQVLGSILRPLGYQVEFATNGKQAIQWVKDHAFDLILLDIMMPEISGYEVCQEIRKIETYKDIPIIFLTAKTDNESIVKGFELGAQDYVTKPFEANELLSRVKTHLQLKHSKSLLGETNKWLEKVVAERTAELVAAKKELEELDQVKTEFLNLLNHELRTPLNGILGGLSLLQGYDLPGEMGQFLNMLDISAKRLEKFSYKALEISEIRTRGREALHLEEHNLVETLQEVVTDVTGLAKSKNILLNLACSREVMPILTDKKKIRNTITYIVENAVRYSDSGSFIHVVAKVENEQIVCLIKDQGTGFSDYALHQLFRPFSNTRDHVDANAGLSLYYAKLVMDANEGTISVEKNIPKGTVVRLSLPSHRAET